MKSPKPPRISQKTLDEMGAGMRRIGNAETEFHGSFHRGTQWLTERLSIGYVDVYCVANAERGWLVRTRIKCANGEVITLDEPAPEWPDALMAQIMLVT